MMCVMAPAFVILEHSGHGPVHYDLMLEEGAALATWQLDRAAWALSAGAAMPARKLPDHRRDYLACEGPVSRGRGRVRRLEAGTYELLRAEEGLWEVRMNGSALRGRFEFRRVGPEADRWQLRRLSDDFPQRRQAWGGTGEATGPGLGR
jgi:hypothetical protein